MNFKEFTFLSEAVEPEQHLKHLTHAEDRVLYGGRSGFHHVHEVLSNVHASISGQHSPTKVTIKKDGSPSIVAGYHPENGKFFVASKSAFNKDPKINYSEADIEANHGHAPGLVEKLKHALKHLPKVMPKKGVYQGDVMHSHDDLHHTADHVSFTPNTITYTAKRDSEEGRKVLNSKFGVAFHTKYEGPSFDKMKATFNPNMNEFKKHKDVNLVSVEHETKKSSLSPTDHKKFQLHMNAAKEINDKIHDQAYHATESHAQHIETYINSTVRTGDKPSVEGYKEHLRGRLQKEVDKVKTDKAKQSKTDTLNAHMKHIDDNKSHIANVLKIHGHIQKAKNVLVKALDAHQTYEHSIKGEKAAPEGYVAVHHGIPTKLVNREEFSRANFANNRGRSEQKEGA